MQAIDYSALPSSEGKRFVKQKIPSPLKFAGLSIGAIISILVGVALVTTGAAIVPLYFTVYIILPIYILINLRTVGRGGKAFKKFVDDNGWNLGLGAPPRDAMEKLGYFVTSSKLSGELDSIHFTVASIVPNEGETATMKSTTVIILDMPKKLPTLLVAPNKGIQTEIMPTRAFVNLGLSRLKLEGDFDVWLRLYSVPGNEIDTLAYMTPDIMAVMIDDITNKILYLEDHIYIFTELLDTIVRKQYEKIFSEAQLIIKEVLEKQSLS